MSPDPLVSIIINNYNYARFLPDAIESAIHQTYPNVEIIVVDDGSTDASRDVIASYGTRIVPILKSNQGQASTFNVGFARSRGDMIIFLDADDLLLPATAQHAVDCLQANPCIAKVMFRMEIIDATGRRTGMLQPPPHLPLRSGDLRRYVLTFPFDMTWVATSGNAFSARVLREVFPMPQDSFRLLADFYLAHTTPLFGDVAFLNETGAYYRVHGSNNYARLHTGIDLNQYRQTIIYAENTAVHIKRFADQLALANRPTSVDEILSISILFKRVVSLKLDPARHPIPGDRIGKLFLLGIRSAMRRFDVSLLMRLLYVVALLALVLVPKRLTGWLAALLTEPEQRGRLNQLLHALHLPG